MPRIKPRPQSGWMGDFQTGLYYLFCCNLSYQTLVHSVNVGRVLSMCLTFFFKILVDNDESTPKLPLPAWNLISTM